MHVYIYTYAERDRESERGKLLAQVCRPMCECWTSFRGQPLRVDLIGAKTLQRPSLDTLQPSSLGRTRVRLPDGTSHRAGLSAC